MRHLEKYEDFAYHSEMFEEDMKKKRKDDEEELIQKNKCQKCTSQRKPIYVPTTREIPRLF
jgi:hypothetical protein